MLHINFLYIQENYDTSIMKIYEISDMEKNLISHFKAQNIDTGCLKLGAEAKIWT
jgi:hypothetical protein